MKPDDPGHPRELLSALLDGELAAADRGAIDRHLAGCPACRALLEDLRRLTAASVDDPVPPVPADLESRIRVRIDNAHRPADAGAVGPAAGRDSGHRSFWFSPLPLGAAAGLLVAVIAVAIWQANLSIEPIAPAPSPAGEPVASLPPPDREPIQNVPPPAPERAPTPSDLPAAPAARPYQVVDQASREKSVDSETPEAGAVGSAVEAGIVGPRSLTLVTDLYRAVVTEDGGVMLTSGPSYVCVIPPPEPELRERIRAVTQPASPATELRQLFEQAYAARPAAAGAQGVAARSTDYAAEVKESAAAARDVNDRIDRLIRTHYLPRAEVLCGPLPAPQDAPSAPAPRE